MKRRMSEAEVKVYLDGLGVEDVKNYSLVSNYGYSFTYNGRRYDLRFLANLYGATPNVWRIYLIGGNTTDPMSDDEVRFIDTVESTANRWEER